MNKFSVYVALMQLAHILGEDVVSYKGYRVYKVSEKGFKIPRLKIPNTQERLSVLTEHHEYDPENNPFTIRSYLIPQHSEEDFLKVLDTVGANYNISIDDLGREIEEERNSSQYIVEPGRNSPFDDWSVTGRYFSHDEICRYINKLWMFKNPATNLPLAIVESIGKSLHGRETYLVKISTAHEELKPIILIEAGIHAREWTAPSTALYMIYQLVVNHTHTSKILDKIDFYIIPLSNPDGYEYSRSTDRLWRKTRSFNKGHFGVDGNRNFDFHWGEAGTSGNPSSEVYRGPFPFSEVETRNLRDVGLKYKDRINVFVSLHAFGPCILYPWSYKITAPAPQSEIMDKIAKEAALAIKKYSGTQYVHGSSSTLMYEASGGSDDYFKGVLGVDLSFTFELSSDKRSSFVIPIDKIEGIAAEAFEGFKVIAEKAAGYKKKNWPTEEESPIFRFR